jgi:hypothetical protein
MPDWLIGENSSWFWTMMQFVGLVTSLGIIYVQLRLQFKGNMMQAFLSVADRWDSDHMIAFRRAACQNYQKSDLDVRGPDGEAIAFFEDVSLYVRERVFTIDMVWERYSYYILHYWPMYRDHVRECRTRTGTPWFANFEELHKRVIAHSATEYGIGEREITPEDIARFAKGELRLCAIHGGDQNY